MSELGKASQKQWVILDFICPKEKYRKLIDPNITVHMNTIEKSRYSDTDQFLRSPKIMLIMILKILTLIHKVI